MIKEKLQYISQGNTKEEQELNIYRALDAGVKWVQVRWKNASGKELLELCEKSRVQCSNYKAVCIINDHIHLAELVDADGVHLGLEDDTITQARQILGPEKIIGGTANTLEDVLQRIDESCDYIGLGPLRFTPTKEKLSPVLGFEGYQQLIRDLEKRFLKIPAIYAIGGVCLEDVEFLQQIGIHGVAVSGQITDHPSVVNEFIKSFK